MPGIMMRELAHTYGATFPNPRERTQISLCTDEDRDDSGQGIRLFVVLSAGHHMQNDMEAAGFLQL